MNISFLGTSARLNILPDAKDKGTLKPLCANPITMGRRLTDQGDAFEVNLKKSCRTLRDSIKLTRQC